MWKKFMFPWNKRATYPLSFSFQKETLERYKTSKCTIPNSFAIARSVNTVLSHRIQPVTCKRRRWSQCASPPFFEGRHFRSGSIYFANIRHHHTNHRNVSFCMIELLNWLQWLPNSELFLIWEKLILYLLNQSNSGTLSLKAITIYNWNVTSSM
jgi:hypothetical protein